MSKKRFDRIQVRAKTESKTAKASQTATAEKQVWKKERSHATGDGDGGERGGEVDGTEHWHNARTVRRSHLNAGTAAEGALDPKSEDALAWFGLVRLTSYHAEQRKAQPKDKIVTASAFGVCANMSGPKHQV